jgi:CHAT domain-containing protein/tetratricopeptide (TPR) repeat protein
MTDSGQRRLSPTAVAVFFFAFASVALPSCERVPGDAPLSALVDALGGLRPVEPRLCGGFAFAPCRPLKATLSLDDRPDFSIAMEHCSPLPPAGSRAWKALAKAVAAIHRSEDRHPNSRALAAAGVASLVTNTAAGADRAVRNLEAAASESADASTLSDLAAAYLLRAGLRQEPIDLIRALDAAQKAVATAPILPEALFNRALILERLHLRDEATAAWKKYRAADRDSPWSAEAARHLDILGHLPTSDLADPERRALRIAAQAGNKTEVLRIVVLSPQSAREHAMNELLARWGEHILHDEREAAAYELATARAIGEALAAMHGDQTVAGAVAAIDRAGSHLPGSDVSAALARAHLAFKEGSRLAVLLSLEKAKPLLSQARDTFVLAGSPVALWASSALAGVDLSGGRNDQAIASFTRLIEGSAPAVYPALHGRVRWGLGLIHGRQGNLAISLADFQSASVLFQQAREIRNQATVDSLTAEIHQLLGQGDAAWSRRYRALAILSTFRGSPQLHIVLWVMIDALRQDGRLLSALAFQDEDVSAARQSGDAFTLAMTLLERSRLHGSLGDPVSALADIESARAWNARGEGRETRERMAANLDLAEGELRLTRDPRSALDLLTRTLAAFRAQGRPFETCQVMLDRARALLRCGAPGQAESQLQTAIELFSRQRGNITDPELRQTYSETAQGLFDEMILLQAQVRHNPRRSFEYSEQARTVPDAELGFSAQPASFPMTVPHDLSRLPARIAVVEYSLARDHLLTWIFNAGRMFAFDRPIDPQRMVAAVGAFVAAVQAGDDQKIKGTSSALYPYLIPPVLESLDTRTAVVFIPDKALSSLPFAALRSPVTGRYLIEERSITLAPSVRLYLSILDRNRSIKGRDEWSPLLIGNPSFDRRVFPRLPDLPGAAAETEALRRLYPASVVIAGRDATASRLLAEIDRHEIFSFAGHAVENPRSPRDSYLVLAPSTQLDERSIVFAHEIGERRLQCLRLVVLSTCHTAAAASSRTGGIGGMTRSFLQAGARAVLGTLWDVDDAATSRLLPEFHRRFVDGADTASALRGAQLAMLHGTERSFRSPSYWAAFQAVGEID